MKEKDHKTIAKFRFNLENYACVWIRDIVALNDSKEVIGKGAEEIIIPKEHCGIGKHHERWFRLEGESNPSHWINYRQVYSPKQNKVLIKIWYKKTQGEQRNDYSLTIPKGDSNMLEVVITNQNEMIKKYDETKHKEAWINK